MEALKWIVKKSIQGLEARTSAIGNSLLKWAKDHFPEHLFQRPSLFHRWVAKKLKTFHKKRGQKLCIVAPRGNAKSTWISLIYITLAALEGWESYIIIVSDSATQARLLLAAIRDVIEFSEELRESYPLVAGKGPVWQQDKLKLNNGVMIEVFGTKGKIRGRKGVVKRPSLIVIDDPQNDENIESGDQRIKAQSWLDKAVIPAGDKRTNLIMVGTSLHRESLVMNAMNNPGWEGHLFKSVIKWPNAAAMKLWKQWEDIYCDKSIPERQAMARLFYESNEEAMLAGSKVLWKHEESLYDLMILRITTGKTAFESEKQNNPRKPQTVEFPDEYFSDWIWIDSADWLGPAELDHRVITLDPSKGKTDGSKRGKKGDYSAITLLGRCPDQLLHCQVDMKRRPVTKMVADLISHMRWYWPNAVGIESNAFQELLEIELIRQIEEIEDKKEREKLLAIPIHLINNTVNKVVRIRRLGARLSQRELRFLKGHKETKMCVNQLEDFPTGTHDDGPDSLEMACRLLVQVVNGELEGEFLSNNLFNHGA